MASKIAEADQGPLRFQHTFLVFIFKFNLLILVRVIKEMNTMQPTAGERHNHQIR